MQIENTFTPKTMAQELLRDLKDNINAKNKDGEENPQNILASLMDSLKNMPGVSDEQKESLLKTLGGGIPNQSSMVNGVNYKIQLVLLFTFFGIIALACGCVVWKLNRSSTARDRRIEMKRTEKEQKKMK